MKFLASEYASIKALIDSTRLAYEEFSFVKKRGRLHMLYRGEPVIAFHRKTVTALNESKQWEKRVTYLIFKEKESMETSEWSAVLEAFSAAIEAVKSMDH